MCRYRVPLGGGHDPAAGLTTEEERYARLAYNIHMPEVDIYYTTTVSAVSATYCQCSVVDIKIMCIFFQFPRTRISISTSRQIRRTSAFTVLHSDTRWAGQGAGEAGGTGAEH